jgi:hypothetical protein
MVAVLLATIRTRARDNKCRARVMEEPADTRTTLTRDNTALTEA